MVNFDRVEWIVEPDPSTAAAALQTGEVDWLEFPVLDLLPMLRKSHRCDVVRYRSVGALAIIAFNHLYPPFDNPKLLRALLPAINQQDYVTAWVGEQQDLGTYPVASSPANSPMANDAGMEAFTSPRDLEKAKKLVAESGYKGEKIVMMAPSDQPSLVAPSQVSRELFVKLGLNVDYQVMDWGTLVARRAKMDPPRQGGWNVFHTTWGGLATSNPGSSYPLRGNGKEGWFGWPTDPKMEELRDQWFDASDVAEQKKICEQIQLQAFQSDTVHAGRPVVLSVGDPQGSDRLREVCGGAVLGRAAGVRITLRSLRMRLGWRRTARLTHQQKQQQRRQGGEDHQHVIVDIGDDLRLMVDHPVQHCRAVGCAGSSSTRRTQCLQCAVERIDRGADDLVQRLRIVREQRRGHGHADRRTDVAARLNSAAPSVRRLGASVANARTCNGVNTRPRPAPWTAW